QKKKTQTTPLPKNNPPNTTPNTAGAAAPPRHSILGFWFVLANSFFAIKQFLNRFLNARNKPNILILKIIKPKSTSIGVLRRYLCFWVWF
ncbi:MAG: hypothetical protein ACK400_21475, partial [Pseudanabaena sp.]